MSLNKSFQEILNKIEDLIKQGNISRIIVRDSNGNTFMEFPILVGVIGIFAAPIVSSIGLIIGILSNFSIEVIKKDSENTSEIFKVKVDE